VAHHELLRYFGEASVDLTVLYEEDAAGAAVDDSARAIERASLFMLRNDLAGYLLLGDPAARLPIEPARAEAAGDTAARPGDLAARAASLLGVPAMSAAHGAADVATMEAAVLALLHGDSAEAICARASRRICPAATWPTWWSAAKSRARCLTRRLPRLPLPPAT